MEYLPGFAFDVSNFYGHRPVSTWEWFFPSEVPQGQAENKLIGHTKIRIMEHPEPIQYEWDEVTVAGAGDPDEVLSKGAPDVLEEKWEATLPCGV